MDIGKRIRGRRIEIGMTQDRLAELVGVSRSNILRYEHGGINEVPSGKLKAIADALHVDAGYFLEEEPPHLTPAQIDLVNETTGLPEERIRFYTRMIRELEGEANR